jgi:hypothetical protein
MSFIIRGHPGDPKGIVCYGHAFFIKNCTSIQLIKVSIINNFRKFECLPLAGLSSVV